MPSLTSIPPDSGFWILDSWTGPGFWILDYGFWRSKLVEACVEVASIGFDSENPESPAGAYESPESIIQFPNFSLGHVLSGGGRVENRGSSSGTLGIRRSTRIQDQPTRNRESSIYGSCRGFWSAIQKRVSEDPRFGFRQAPAPRVPEFSLGILAGLKIQNLMVGGLRIHDGCVRA